MSRIRIETELPEHPCFVDVDPSQFDTALVNMAVNARGAMLTGALCTRRGPPPPSQGGPARQVQIRLRGVSATRGTLAESG
ncbi:hypothetical protein MKK84_19365 [Methylobacterium sp. E-065]|uniref:hypothetical protein n=1 Tax=Methylobacterium sp. E-065 TaxID=2836583 RepID=UPI001FB98E24|nr:hypothetical protein [Methylobacterium sp. E-065]MCJ2019567.1 hypothetical protein [Methylobacterium sp. E-065]